MKNSIALSICISLGLLIGCTDGLLDARPERASEEMSQPMEGPSLAMKRIKYVPYRERGTLTPTMDPRADLGAACEEGAFEVFNRKEGIASHLGRITGFENACVDATTFGAKVLGVNFAANGDRIFFMALCRAPTPGAFVCELTVTGGTGRFENASTPPGEPVVVDGTIDFATGIAEFSSKGKISSVGSSME